jgi:hypothetical protein
MANFPRTYLTIGVVALLLGALFVTQRVRSEVVQVKYRGEVDLKSFSCADVTQSSFIKRVCYDRMNEYVLISLNGTYYHYCEMPDAIVSSLMSAESMGRFYNASIKGHFDCRTRKVPAY